MRSDRWLLIPILISFGRYAQAEVTFGPRAKVPVVSTSSAAEVAMSVFALPEEQAEVMVFGRSPVGGGWNHDFWQSSRVVPDGEWSRPVKLGRDINSPYIESVPHITADGLTLLLDDGVFFDSSAPHRPDGFGQGDIWMATRETTEDDFGVPENLGETINSRYHDGSPTLSPDGLTLYFESQRPDGRVGRTDLWMASRDRPDMPWNVPVNLGEPINSRGHDVNPTVSPDGLRLFFSSDRSGSYDIWMSSRDTPNDPWNDPVQLDENVNHPEYMEVTPGLSPDGSTLYLAANLSSSPYVLTWDIYEVPILSDTQNGPMLLPGDADQDLDFDQLDLVRVQVSAKYLTGQPATWGEGDWDGAPGGSQGNPPAGDGHFNQFDIIAAQRGAAYLTGPYASIAAGGQRGDGQTSVIYDPSTGEVAVDAPSAVELTSINIDSATGVFVGETAQNLGGSFDNDADDNIFKATFGSTFGSLSFGNVAQTGLSEEFVRGDLIVIRSLSGGGDLGSVDLVYVPEPASFALLAVGIAIGLLRRKPVHR